MYPFKNCHEINQKTNKNPQHIAGDMISTQLNQEIKEK